jgi:chemotaxis protein CheD
MSTPERLSLVERMALARSRTAEARLTTTAQHAGTHGHGQPHGGGHSHALGPSWQVDAKPGQHVVLMPGQMHFGHHAGTIRTLLGSCVSITLWHPIRKIGGMCHYLLPSRSHRLHEPTDGKYGDEAIEAMVKEIEKTRTNPKDYIAHLYGGADTMPDGTNLKFNVGERNIEQGWKLIDQYGFQLMGVDVGEDVPRTVTITLATGDVTMNRGAGKAPPPVGLPPRPRR